MFCWYSIFQKNVLNNCHYLYFLQLSIKKISLNLNIKSIKSLTLKKKRNYETFYH